MRKVLLIVIAVALVVCALGTLYACESYKAKPISPVGDKNAAVESNGGLIVKQGNYLYFVNGYVSLDTLGEAGGKANWFGTPVKGSIVRVAINEDGTLGNDYVVVVPKTVTASSEYVGFSIYGEWIYYVSPSSDEDRSGTVQTSTLQFFRTKIDGTGTQLIMNLEEGSEVQYKYTSSALIWYDSEENLLYSKSLDAKKFKKKDKGTLVAYGLSAVTFLKNPDYAGKSTLADYVLYTKDSAASKDYTNTLYIMDPSGKNGAVLIGPKSYPNAGKKYNVKVLATDVRDEKLTVYYTKTYYPGISSSGTSEGTFAYTFDSTFTFDETKEVKIADTELSDLYPIEGGVITTGENATIYYLNGAEKKVYDGLNLNSNLLAYENGYFYYVKDSKVMYFAANEEYNAQYVYNSDEKISDNDNFADAEYLNGYVYFLQDDDYKYLRRVKVMTVEDYYAGTVRTVEHVEIVTDEDKAKMAEAETGDSDSDEK